MKKATRPEEQSRLLQGQSSTAAPTKIDDNGTVHHGMTLYALREGPK